MKIQCVGTVSAYLNIVAIQPQRPYSLSYCYIDLFLTRADKDDHAEVVMPQLLEGVGLHILRIDQYDIGPQFSSPARRLTSRTDPSCRPLHRPKYSTSEAQRKARSRLLHRLRFRLLTSVLNNRRP